MQWPDKNQHPQNILSTTVELVSIGDAQSVYSLAEQSNIINNMYTIVLFMY